jgi:hypothetical protein
MESSPGFPAVNLLCIASAAGSFAHDFSCEYSPISAIGKFADASFCPHLALHIVSKLDNSSLE